MRASVCPSSSRLLKPKSLLGREDPGSACDSHGEVCLGPRCWQSSGTAVSTGFSLLPLMASDICDCCLLHFCSSREVWSPSRDSDSSEVTNQEPGRQSGGSVCSPARAHMRGVTYISQVLQMGGSFEDFCNLMKITRQMLF